DGAVHARARRRHARPRPERRRDADPQGRQRRTRGRPGAAGAGVRSVPAPRAADRRKGRAGGSHRNRAGWRADGRCPEMNRRPLLIGVALVTVAAASTAVALGVRAGTRRGAAGGPHPNTALPPATAPVVTKTLTDTTEVDGKLGYGDRVDLSARGAGTITWLPAAGAVVERGAPMYKLDELPITLLYGTLPA